MTADAPTTGRRDADGARAHGGDGTVGRPPVRATRSAGGDPGVER
jgi:hypothetical protein